MSAAIDLSFSFLIVIETILLHIYTFQVLHTRIISALSSGIFQLASAGYLSSHPRWSLAVCSTSYLDDHQVVSCLSCYKFTIVDFIMDSLSVLTCNIGCKSENPKRMSYCAG
ncbi:hypothetical protein HN51_004484 [Arachis hypogaea]